MKRDAARCEYAACHEPGSELLDGWTFCAGHAREHRALIREERPAPDYGGILAGWAARQRAALAERTPARRDVVPRGL